MRRRLVWIQGAAEEGPALFSLWEGPDGYYVVNGAGMPTLAAPYSDGDSPFGIFRSGFTVTGANDWRYGAVGLRGDSVSLNLFYGPSGLLSTQATASGVSAGNGAIYRSGLLTNAIDRNSGIRQRYWYTQTASGTDGINTFPNIPEIYVLPGQKGSDESGTVWYANSDLSWAVCSGTLLKADGTTITIVSGEPDPWPNIFDKEACMVGLTLFVFDQNPTPPSISFTPYRYNPDTGTATAEAPITMPYAEPGEDYGPLRFVSYWTPTP
jgi:hypothetical protein